MVIGEYPLQFVGDQGDGALPMVYPSGLDMCTSRTPIVLPAPGLLTIITGWPRAAEAFWHKGRARISPSEPASRGTMKLMGFTGYRSAALACSTNCAPCTSKETPRTNENNLFIFASHS